MALLGGVVAFSSVAHAEVILKEGITPASDANQIPTSAKLRTDTVVAGISEPQGIFNPYFFVNGWDENVTNVIFSRLIDWDSQASWSRDWRRAGRSARTVKSIPSNCALVSPLATAHR